MFRRPFVLLALMAVALTACDDKTPAPKAAKPDKPVAEEASGAAVGQDGLTGQTVVDPSKGPAINESDEVGRKLMALYPDM